jgi:hypothetical protein
METVAARVRRNPLGGNLKCGSESSSHLNLLDVSPFAVALLFIGAASFPFISFALRP